MIRRYLRALIGAIRMTASGKTPPPSPLAPLRAWMLETSTLTDAVAAACAGIGLDTAARRKTILMIEGRRVNLNTVLLAAKFHAQHEYRLLLQTPDERSLTALYATNVNDCFLLSRFISVLPDGDAQILLKRLITHLEAAPMFQNKMLT